MWLEIIPKVTSNFKIVWTKWVSSCIFTYVSKYYVFGWISIKERQRDYKKSKYFQKTTLLSCLLKYKRWNSKLRRSWLWQKKQHKAKLLLVHAGAFHIVHVLTWWGFGGFFFFKFRFWLSRSSAGRAEVLHFWVPCNCWLWTQYWVAKLCAPVLQL